MITATIGNKALLTAHKNAFLCSRKIPASAALKCYDWAIAQREACNCVISGFHSQSERDVLHYLLKGRQPIIVVLARGLKQDLKPELQQPFNEGRLLLISPFGTHIKRISANTAEIRNKMMLEITNDIVIGYADPKGVLAKLLNTAYKNRHILHL